MIGTTDVDHDADPGAVACSDAERDYLIAAANSFFAIPLTREDVVGSFAGVRPLYDDGASSAAAATRDYVLTCEDDNGSAPLVNVFGGKITTYRRLAEQVMDRLAPFFPTMGGRWSGGEPLPGGDFELADKAILVARLQEEFAFLTPVWAERLITAYGTEAFMMIDGARSADDLGRHFGSDLHAREVDWLLSREWAQDAEDILWRRSKLGLILTADEVKALSTYVMHRLQDGDTDDIAAAE